MFLKLMKLSQIMGQAASDSYLDLKHAAYVLYGVKYIDLVSLALFSGKSDPFVVLSLNQAHLEQRMTETVDDDLNPTWKQQFFHFVVTNTNSPLHFQVNDDDDSLNRTSTLGSCSAQDYAELAPNTLTETVMPLRHKNKKAGTLKVNLEWKPFLPKDIQGVDNSKYDRFRAKGIVFCRITRCSHLQDEPTDISITIENESDSIVKTEEDAKNLTGTNPVVQQKLSVPFYSITKNLDVVVHYKNGRTSKCMVSMEDIISNRNHLTRTCDLELDGKIECTFDLQFIAPSNNAGRPRQHEFKQGNQGLLRIKIDRAENVKNIEKFSKSDPFCQINLKSEMPPQSKATRHIADNLDPQWHEWFEFVIGNPVGDIFFDIMDHERFGAARPLGQASVKLTSLTPNTHVRLKLPVYYKGKVDAQNPCFVHVQVEWKPFLAHTTFAGLEKAASQKETSSEQPAEPAGTVDAAWKDHAWASEVLQCFVENWKEPEALKSKLVLQIALDGEVQPQQIECLPKATYINGSFIVARPHFKKTTQICFHSNHGSVAPEAGSSSLLHVTSIPKEAKYFDFAVKVTANKRVGVKFAAFISRVGQTANTITEAESDRVMARARGEQQARSEQQQVQRRQSISQQQQSPMGDNMGVADTPDRAPSRLASTMSVTEPGRSSTPASHPLP